MSLLKTGNVLVLGYLVWSPHEEIEYTRRCDNCFTEITTAYLPSEHVFHCQLDLCEDCRSRRRR